MNTGKTTSIVKVSSLPEYTLPGKAKLIISQGLQDQIDYLHKKCGNVEWSGFLFYEVTEGNFQDASKLVIRADDIFLMDIGTSAHTEANIEGSDLIEMYEKIPGAEDGKRYGLCHSHNTMKCYFSAEDASELNDNIRNHSYYLSLIVNFEGGYVAKLVWLGEVLTGFKFKDLDERDIEASSSKEVMMVIDFDVKRIEKELEVPEYITNRFQGIKEKREEATKKVTGQAYYYSSGSNTSRIPSYPLKAGEWDNDPPTYRGTSIGFNADRRSEDERTGRWDDEYDPIDTHYERPPSIWGQGAIQTKAQGKKLQGKVVAMSDSEAKEFLCDWLTECSSVVRDTSKTISSQFLTAKEALIFYEGIFKGRKSGDSEYQYFINQAQVILVKQAKDYSPEVLARRLSTIINDYADSCSIAPDLAEIAQSHPAYLREYNKSLKKELNGGKESSAY